MDFSELFDLDEINRALDLNRDPYRKEIADRVRVNDFSSATYLDGTPIDYERSTDASFSTEFIVIATHERSSYNVYYTVYQQNLIICDPYTNTQLRINSGHVTLK